MTDNSEGTTNTSSATATPQRQSRAGGNPAAVLFEPNPRFRGLHTRWLPAVIALLTLTTLLPGCRLFHRPEIETVEVFFTNQPVDYFVSPWYYRMPPARIVLMVPQCRNNNFELQTRFAESLARNLKQVGLFDIVVEHGPCQIASESIRLGNFDTLELLRITRRHQADGILFCEVDSFSGYDPLHLGCSLTLVDTRESIVTLHASGHWDTRLENVRRAFTQHVCDVHHCKQHAAAAYLQSPTELFDFITRDLAEFWNRISLRESG